MEEHFNAAEAIAAQKKYCDDHCLPHFAPHDGICWRCHRQIYAGEWVETPYGKYHSGVSVEKAGSSLVTGCPHCNRSYCD